MMKLFKWTEGLKPNFPKFIENLFGDKINDEVGTGENVATVPSVNVESQASKYNIEVAMPGLDKSDINIQNSQAILDNQ